MLKIFASKIASKSKNRVMKPKNSASNTRLFHTSITVFCFNDPYYTKITSKYNRDYPRNEMKFSVDSQKKLSENLAEISDNCKVVFDRLKIIEKIIDDNEHIKALTKTFQIASGDEAGWNKSNEHAWEFDPIVSQREIRSSINVLQIVANNESLLLRN